MCVYIYFMGSRRDAESLSAKAQQGAQFTAAPSHVEGSRGLRGLGQGAAVHASPAGMDAKHGRKSGSCVQDASREQVVKGSLSPTRTQSILRDLCGGSRDGAPFSEEQSRRPLQKVSRSDFKSSDLTIKDKQ